MNFEYQDRQHNLKPGEIYMIQRRFSMAVNEVFPEVKDVVYYHYEPGVCSWFLSYDVALAFALKAGWKYGTWAIVKMIPIPRDKDGLEIVTFKGESNE